MLICASAAHCGDLSANLSFNSWVFDFNSFNINRCFVASVVIFFFSVNACFASFNTFFVTHPVFLEVVDHTVLKGLIGQICINGFVGLIAPNGFVNFIGTNNLIGLVRWRGLAAIVWVVTEIILVWGRMEDHVGFGRSKISCVHQIFRFCRWRAEIWVWHTVHSESITVGKLYKATTICLWTAYQCAQTQCISLI